MIRFLPILPFLAVLASCTPGAAPSAITPPAPARAAAVAPEASKIREQIIAADQQATVIAGGAVEARRAATAAREEAAWLKGRKTANEAELTKLWQDIQAVETRNLFLETETSRLTANLTDARRAAATLQQYASAKDAEADQLRAGHDHLSTTVAGYAKQLASSQKAVAGHRAQADRLLGEIRLYRIALGVAVAIVLAWIAVKLFLPRLSIS